MSFKASNTTTEGTAMCTNNKWEGQWEQLGDVFLKSKGQLCVFIV